eukprot:1488-Heterococcus_DN1.PRE.3
MHDRVRYGHSGSRLAEQTKAGIRKLAELDFFSRWTQVRCTERGMRPAACGCVLVLFSTRCLAFTCQDGSKTILDARVNDNYCDCDDGSDETTTPACAGQHGARSTFACTGDLPAELSIPMSRVWDGVCDCCDGADEPASSSCSNRCADRAKEQQAGALQLFYSIHSSLNKKAEMAAAGAKLIAEWQAQARSAIHILLMHSSRLVLCQLASSAAIQQLLLLTLVLYATHTYRGRIEISAAALSELRSLSHQLNYLLVAEEAQERSERIRRAAQWRIQQQQPQQCTQRLTPAQLQELKLKRHGESLLAVRKQRTVKGAGTVQAVLQLTVTDAATASINSSFAVLSDYLHYTSSMLCKA